MNTERYMVTAVPIEGSERVTGFYRETQGYECETLHLIHSIELNCQDYVIDPATIKPVRVKPELRSGAYGGYYCPNCGAWFCAVSEEQIKHHRLENTTPFCGNCGQALDWGVEADEES